MYLYTDPILTAAKKYRCRCEGLCNEYVINGESTNSEGYQQRNVSIIKIFFWVSNILPPFTIYYFKQKKFVNNIQNHDIFQSSILKLCEGNMPIKTQESVHP